MKGFLSASAAAFVAGILLLMATPFIQSALQPAPGAAKLDVYKSDDFILIDRSIAEKINNFYNPPETFVAEQRRTQNLALSVASIENVGDTDIQNVAAAVNSTVDPSQDDFVAFGVLGTPGSQNVPDRNLELEGSNLRINIPLLRRGEQLDFWYLFEPFNLSNISARMANVEVSQTRPYTQRPADAVSQSGWGAFDVGLFILFGLAIFLLGIGLSEYFNNQVLRAVGLDPKEIQDLYLKAQKDKKDQGNA